MLSDPTEALIDSLARVLAALAAVTLAAIEATPPAEQEAMRRRLADHFEDAKGRTLWSNKD